MQVYCHGCLKWVDAEQKFGGEVCPDDLTQAVNLFWVCPHCKNFVEDNNGNPAHPIYTPELKNMFHHLYALVDDIIKETKCKKDRMHRAIATALGLDEYCLEWICCVREGRRVYRQILQVKEDMKKPAKSFRRKKRKK